MHLITPQQPHPLFNTAATRRLEQQAAAALPPHTLMQRAGLAVARLAQALALATQVAAGPELAMARIKTLCRNAYANTLQEQLEQEAQCMVQSQETEESREGIGAFLEKRLPDFAPLRQPPA